MSNRRKRSDGQTSAVRLRPEYGGTPSQAERILQTLRYGPDQIIVNPFDEQVWLASFTTPRGQRGLTDCCLTSAPCAYHEALYDGRCPAPWVPALQWVQHWSGVQAAFPADPRFHRISDCRALGCTSEDEHHTPPAGGEDRG